MRVAVIPHAFQEHYTLGFVNGLARKGLQVEFARAANMNIGMLDRKVHWTDLKRNTDDSIGILRKMYRFGSYHLRLIAYVVARRDAVVHVIGLLRTPLLTGIIEGFIFRMLARKYVLTVHDILPHDRHTSWNRWLFRQIYRIPHMLVVHTPRMKNELVASYGVVQSRIIVMQHGINDIVSDHEHTRPECRLHLAVPQDACLLLLFGRVAPYKGVEVLLEAFRALNAPIYLVIAGAPINAEYGRHIEALVREHPNRYRILYHLQYIEDYEIATYFRAADAVVMPYTYIDQSGVPFLAFRFGLPVIAFNVGSLSEYVQGDVGLIIHGNSAKDLVEAIETFRRERHRFVPERIEKYALRFRWENVLDSVIQAYGRS